MTRERRVRRDQRSALVCFAVAGGRAPILMRQCYVWLFRAAGASPAWLEPA